MLSFIAAANRPARSLAQHRFAPLTRRLLGLGLLWATGASHAVANETAMEVGLKLEPAAAQCSLPTVPVPAVPAAAQQRLPQSQAVHGSKDIAWVWLGSPTTRYPHAAFGSPEHAGSLHVLVADTSGALQQLTLTLPMQRVFEDRVPRLVDIDGDGRDEIILVEADAARGAALVVFGLRATAPATAPGTAAGLSLVELARSPFVGTAFRWLNPAGVADFDGDGRLDIASVTTPHIGGVLTLYHFRPPQLLPFARAVDVSNHRFGILEQRLAVVVEQPGRRPTLLVPDMQHTALQALRWDAPGQWSRLDEPVALRARIEHLTPLAGGACVLLADASWWRLTLAP
jgi:hypothetical protein